VVVGEVVGESVDVGAAEEVPEGFCEGMVEGWHLSPVARVLTGEQHVLAPRLDLDPAGSALGRRVHEDGRSRGTLVDLGHSDLVGHPAGMSLGRFPHGSVSVADRSPARVTRTPMEKRVFRPLG
jgi:hypothetical protein